MKLSRTLSSTLTETGQIVPSTASVIPVVTKDVNLFSNDQMKIETISLRSLMKEGRYLVLNFGSCTCPPFLATF